MSVTPFCHSGGFPVNDLSALASKLQDTARAVLAFCDASHHGDSALESGDSAQTGEQSSQKPGEYRQYHLPPHALRAEGELLERYKAKRFADALDEIYNDLFVMAFLMRGYDTAEDVDAFNLCLIGERLSRSLEMLSKATSTFADFELVHVMRVPA